MLQRIQACLALFDLLLYPIACYLSRHHILFMNSLSAVYETKLFFKNRSARRSTNLWWKPFFIRGIASALDSGACVGIFGDFASFFVLLAHNTNSRKHLLTWVVFLLPTTTRWGTRRPHTCYKGRGSISWLLVKSYSCLQVECKLSIEGCFVSSCVSRMSAMQHTKLKL